jgi:hypothetical protein
VVACSDVGVTCEALSAAIRNDRFVVNGRFGVFYKGHCWLVLLDRNGDKVKEMPPPVPVTPLRPLEFAKVWQLTPDNQVPANAVRVALHLYDAKGQFLGEFAIAEIQR